MREKLQSPPTILVVGAGPAGLAFALACIRGGLAVRIIEKRSERLEIGKATGVAQSVWHQLGDFGITPRTVDNAKPMRGFIFHDDDRLVARINVPNVNGTPPAYLYPQVKLERAMENALSALGIEVEYGRRMSAIVQNDAKVVATVCDDAGNIESIDVDWLIAADGSHSKVRSDLGIAFPGRDYPERWSVAEIRTEEWPSGVQAQLFLRSDGVGLFLSQPSPGVVQGILNAEGVANNLIDRFLGGNVVYERVFKVALRRVSSPRHGRVWLIGDAAHVQSPVGGQGLSLAIWDGLTLGKALVQNDEAVERALRKRARLVLAFTDFDYRMLSTRSPVLRSLRNTYWSFAAKFPLAARWFFKLIAG